MHSEAAWSALTPQPVLLYSKKVDNYIVYWAGVGMTRSMALSLAGVIFFKIWASPQVKYKLWEEFLQIYYAGGFQTNDWDDMIAAIKSERETPHERYYSYIASKVRSKLQKKRDSGVLYIGDDYDLELKAESPAEVLSWFKNDRAIIAD